MSIFNRLAKPKLVTLYMLVSTFKNNFQNPVIDKENMIQFFKIIFKKHKSNNKFKYGTHHFMVHKKKKKKKKH